MFVSGTEHRCTGTAVPEKDYTVVCASCGMPYWAGTPHSCWQEKSRNFEERKAIALEEIAIQLRALVKVMASSDRPEKVSRSKK